MPRTRSNSPDPLPPRRAKRRPQGRRTQASRLEVAHRSYEATP
jgi:hypothetical protein